MVTLLLKATDQCNARCRYCFAIERGRGGARMRADVVQTALQRADEYLAASPGETVELLWHGGEPLLLGERFFRDVIDAQGRLCRATGARIRHTLQTNLTLLDGYWLDLFDELSIRAIGTSYDPLPGLRGFSRDLGARIDSESYNTRFMKAVSLLESRGVEWSVIYVVTRLALGSAPQLLRYLTNLVPSGAITFVPMLGREATDLATTPAEHARFLGEAFAFWWPQRQRHDGVQPFAGVCEALLEERRDPGCMDFGLCEGRCDQIEIDPAGNVGHACLPIDGHSETMGRLEAMSISDALARHREWLARANGDCTGCRLSYLCHPSGASNAEGPALRRSDWCEVRLRFIEDYVEPITGVRHGSSVH
jgi:sulfatase maturation enzyme AslB (radical SAM superfamily)